MQILNEQQEKLLKDERSILNDLRVLLVQTGTTPEDQQTLADSIRQLEEMFLLVIVGEFNAGKSAFINALMGQKLLKEGVTPTTTQINVLRYADPGQAEPQPAGSDHHNVILLPIPLLEQISIVDTPGTNAIIREHEEITSQFMPRSDLVLFITSADRPFTESERAFLQRIRDWGKKVVFVINKIDILDSEADVQQVVEFVTENARSLLGIRSDIFPVSARLALKAKQGEPELWQKSRFEALEQYIQRTLDEKSRIQLKLLNPLGIGQHLAGRYLDLTHNRLELLKEDVVMLDDVEGQLAVYREDMLRDFNYRMADIDNILYEMENRGNDFFDETFRLGRIFDLLSKARIQQDFEHIVVADVPQRIERKVNELIDWLVNANLHQWQAVTEHLAERRRQHQSRIVGDAAIGSFHYDRERLMDAVGLEARRVVDTYDREVEARQIAEGAQQAVAASAALGVGAIGLGTLVTVLASTAAADITGILLAGMVATLGLFVIPARRRQGKMEMRAKIAELRQNLGGALRAQFTREIERSLQEINEAIAPYTRFVRAERHKLTTVQEKLDHIRNQLDYLQTQINQL